jgi:glycosyltransferase involved in cell wall biosynthesis
MLNTTKVILISKAHLPYDKIASWTNMYNYLLEKKDHNFDYIITKNGGKEADNLVYKYLREVNIVDKVKSKFYGKSKAYNNYIEALDSIIEEGIQYVIHIVDHSGIVIPIDNHLRKKYHRKNFFIQYYYHGFSPLFNKFNGQKFLKAINEMFFLTTDSYFQYLSYYEECSFKARVLNNATDSERFKRVSEEEKSRLRKNNNLDKDEIIYLWCSQDREKKGLHIVLEAFKKVHIINKKTKLIVVGLDRDINQKGVIPVGRIPNNELPMYYQMSDIYLFPSLWKEGFGIVLAEALKCGCYCIASAQGGIPEVLGGGKYGVLINKPNMIDEWVNEMNEAIKILKNNNVNPYLSEIPEKLYDLDLWSDKIKHFISEAKSSFN